MIPMGVSETQKHHGCEAHTCVSVCVRVLPRPVVSMCVYAYVCVCLVCVCGRVCVLMSAYLGAPWAEKCIVAVAVPTLSAIPVSAQWTPGAISPVVVASGKWVPDTSRFKFRQLEFC